MYKMAPVCAYFTILFFVYNLMYKHTYMVNFTCSINDILVNYVNIQKVHTEYRIASHVTIRPGKGSAVRQPSHRSQMTITLQKPTTGHKKML